MDFIDGLPTSQQKHSNIVVVDRLSKYAHFLPLKHPYTAISVAKLFVQNIVKLHGLPQVNVSDRDTLFTSLFWKEVFKLQGVKLNMSSAYHPQTEGQAEALNKCLETYLCCFCFQQQHRWMDWLHWAEYWYHTSSHSSTVTTPFEAVYRDSPLSLLSYVPGTSKVQEVADTLTQQDQILKELKIHLSKAQERMKRLADKKHTDKEHKTGDWVYLKLQPYCCGHLKKIH